MGRVQVDVSALNYWTGANLSASSELIVSQCVLNNLEIQTSM